MKSKALDTEDEFGTRAQTELLEQEKDDSYEDEDEVDLSDEEYEEMEKEMEMGYGGFGKEMAAPKLRMLIVSPDNISLMEYDGTNRSTVYAGPFEDALVFPWPNGTKVVLLTSLNNIVSKNFNLYTLNLK